MQRLSVDYRIDEHPTKEYFIVVRFYSNVVLNWIEMFAPDSKFDGHTKT